MGRSAFPERSAFFLQPSAFPMPRILSISGLRGTIGDRPGLDPEYVVRFAMAVGTMTARAAEETAGSPVVVVSRDGRPSGQTVRHAVLAGLTATGCDVLDLGVATTPTCGVVVGSHDASRHTAAGLQITASHNPAEWNGLKPFNSGGSVLNKDEGQPLLDLLESGDFHLASHDRLGQVRTVPTAEVISPHVERIAKLVDFDVIRASGLKVAADFCNGSGAVHTPAFLRETLGLGVVGLGESPDGRFQHTPEPTEANLTGLCDAVRANGCDLGFAQDPDADRMALVDADGTYIGEELTLALAADHVLATRKGPFVVNGSTSRVNADIAERHGCAFHRSHVGEANVTAMMKDVGAVLGGEGNGGVIEPQVGYVRDSLVAMAYVLEGLAKRRGQHGADYTLADWVATLPRYEIVKDKITCPREKADVAVAALRATYPEAVATEGDGLRLDWPDRWVQVRASNTEPILRVIAEAPDAAAAKTLCGDAMEAVGAAVS